MPGSDDWSRRKFLIRSGAAVTTTAVAGGASGFGQSSRKAAKEAAAAMPPPGVITGGIRPLLVSNTARPLRYTPDGGDFVIHNGPEYFNRPVYGPNNDFRVDAGDLPEFSLYLPGHGGNLKLGLVSAAGAKWLAAAESVTARYRPGRMIYEIGDPLLGRGSLSLELLSAATGAGILLRVTPHAVPNGVTLTWAFAGASGRKGRRNGDIGCEVEPVSQFFQVRAEECAGNVYTIAGSTARLHSAACDLELSFPAAATLAVEDFSAWTGLPHQPLSNATAKLPVLTGAIGLGSSPLMLAIQRITSAHPAVPADADAFATRSAQVARLNTALAVSTPDPYLNSAAAALPPAADVIWDEAQQCVMHGGVAWRVALAGWRGPYALDSLGNHDRARRHFRHWLARQNTDPITSAEPATGPFDPATHLSRKETMLHTNGDLSHSHYDMNMVFFDVLLRHLRWTGDVEFAREIWPALKRHLAWEHRLFRRMYTAADGSSLPLYEAYAAIWASDNLQYNGGGATHSSAYNVFALRSAAVLAPLMNEDAAPYVAEADLIQQGLDQLLWLPAQGAFAESKDILGPQTTYSNPAVWTVYHAIDSEVAAPRQAWQMCAERLAVLRRIPVHGQGVPPGPWFMLSCSNWLPYLWSLTLVVLAENIHMALALWQAGMQDEAYGLLKGSLLDSMYQGLTPGNFHMSSELDVHRQEAQRDFGDPIGITSRALTEGLFGVRPDLIRNAITIRPGFPSDWDRAAIQHTDYDLAWHREGLTETYTFTSRLPKAVPVTLTLPVRTTSLPVVTHAGAAVPCSFDPNAVGAPLLTVTLPAATAFSLMLRWTGKPPTPRPAPRNYVAGEALVLPGGVTAGQLDDPQQALHQGRIAATGFHTVFANLREGDAQWSLPISFDGKEPTPFALPVPSVKAHRKGEPIVLPLQHRLTELFTRGYAEPRSPWTSVAIPEQLIGGWANMDMSATLDDRGLRGASGLLHTPLGVAFATPTGTAPNCLFLSHWEQDRPSAKIALTGRAEGLYLLLTGTTYPQCSRMEHALITVSYSDGSTARLSLRNPENWWPVEQDYLIDDYLFVNEAALPPRVDLATGQTRLLDIATFKGRGRTVRGGAATIVHLPLDPAKTLVSMQFEVRIYAVVAALLAATLVRPA